jgi:PAS domain S-box-containing protein
VVKPPPTTSETASVANLLPGSRELFDLATARLRNLFSFDIAALIIAGSTRTGDKTEILIKHGSRGKEVFEHKVLEQRFDGEFRLVGGQLIVISHGAMGQDVSFIERVVGIDRRALKSGMLLPMPERVAANAVLFLGSFDKKLLRARNTVSLAEIHALLAENGIKNSSHQPATAVTRPTNGQQSSVLYRRIFDGIDLPAAILEEDFTILQVNAAFEKTFGYTNPQLERQRAFGDFISPSERRELLRARENRTRLQFEARLILRSGVEKTFEVTMRKLNNPAIRIATFRDLSGLRESATELRERAERLSVIHEVAKAVNAAGSVDEIFVRLVKQLRYVSEFDYAALAFHNPTAQQIRLEAIFNHGRFSTAKAEMPVREFERLIGPPSIIRAKLPETLLTFLGTKKEKSMLALVLPGKIQSPQRPGASPDQVCAVGCLLLASQYPQAFSHFHVQVLESIADLLGAGIRKVQLLQETQANYQRLTLLSEVSRAIGQSLELENVLHAVVGAAQKAVAAPAAAICLLDQHAIRGRAVAGMTEAEWKWPLHYSKELAAMLQRDRTIFIPEVRRSAFFPDEVKEVLLKKNFHTYLGVPILMDKQPIALLGVFAEEPGTLQFAGAAMLSALAAQAAQVLQNVRLYEQANKTKKYLENLLQSSVDAIVTTDRQGRITYFSQGAEHMLGLAAPATIGQPVSKFVNGGQDEARRLLLKVIRDKKIQSHEGEVLHADGGKVPASLSVSQILADDGRIAGFLAIAKDISGRKAAELESKRRGDELENYIYLITHNLKTPIVSIQGFANLLQDEISASLNKQHAHFLERVQKNAVMMEKMIVDLLDFSRLARPQLNLGLVRVADIVNGVVDEMKLLEHLRDVEFEVAPDLPEVVADAEGLNIVFQNLIGNATKYRRPGVPGKIRVGWHSQPRFYAFHVQDNGIGFDPAFKEKAFALFQRGANTGQIPGTGVGLALVKRIVENHHGLVRIESTPQVGTTVHFTIPKVLSRDN